MAKAKITEEVVVEEATTENSEIKDATIENSEIKDATTEEAVILIEFNCNVNLGGDLYAVGDRLEVPEALFSELSKVAVEVK